MKNLKIAILCIFGLPLAFQINGCREGDYPYFIHGPALARMKPVFLIIVDSSGSNSTNLSTIASLVETAETYLLANLYNGNQEVMDEHLFVGSYPNGEDWVTALISDPTALVTTENPEIDDYPNRIVLFFGNGAGVTTPAGRDTYQAAIDNFTANILPELDFFMARIIITSGADSYYTDWTQCVIDGFCNIPFILPIEPPMAEFNWSHTQYDPGSVDVEYFLDDIVQSINDAL